MIKQGTINADGGSVALLGAHVGNNGSDFGTVQMVWLAAGNTMTLDVAGDGLLNVTVSQGALKALAENGGVIRADGGRVLMTARSASRLLALGSQQHRHHRGANARQSQRHHQADGRYAGWYSQRFRHARRQRTQWRG